MFNPKTDRLKEISEKYPDRVTELKEIFDKQTNVYIDYANVRPWATKLGWHVDPKRLKQFLDSFDTVKSVKFYNGTFDDDIKSKEFMDEIKKCGFDVKTKPVKKMKLSIDVSSIPTDSTAIIKDFIRKPLMQKMDLETIEFLNSKLKKLNEQGIRFIEDLKCNFDVEIGRDMLMDYKDNGIENFVLWSGDSDFSDPLQQLIDDGKKTILFATARRVSTELNDLKEKGLFIYDIQKIKNFICWKKEINLS